MPPTYVFVLCAVYFQIEIYNSGIHTPAISQNHASAETVLYSMYYSTFAQNYNVLRAESKMYTTRIHTVRIYSSPHRCRD